MHLSHICNIIVNHWFKQNFPKTILIVQPPFHLLEKTNTPGLDKEITNSSSLCGMKPSSPLLTLQYRSKIISAYEENEEEKKERKKKKQPL
jgi:hypothetical protein